jgi:hypothetical protein
MNLTNQKYCSTKNVLLGISAFILLAVFLLIIDSYLHIGTLGFLFSWSFVLIILLGVPVLSQVIIKLPTQIAAFLVLPIIYFLLVSTFSLFGALIDQPHPTYIVGNWLSGELCNCIFRGIVFSVLMLILIATDLAVQHFIYHKSKCDIMFYPQPVNLWNNVSLPRLRLVLIVGGLLLLGYYAHTVIYLWKFQESPGGLIWPSERVFFTCMVGWGILWIADCLARPRFGTGLAAIGFLLGSLLLIQSSTACILRE